MTPNETHDVALQSWVASANSGATDFPIQNLPFGVFRRAGSGETFRGGVAIGDQILDLSRAIDAKVFGATLDQAAELAARPRLNDFMAAGPEVWTELRAALSRLLRRGSTSESKLQACLVPQANAEHAVPARIGDYTDFYTSIHHATAIGSLFRPDNPLLPNYKWVPIGYHGRSSSIGVSVQELARPVGQVLPPGASTPIVAPSARLDYELELGVFIGQGNALGSRIDIDDAESHIFGLCLVNDWSARDLQAWEYQPLGPFLSKSFATTISPWIVTLEALAPYRLEWQRGAADPQPLPYLDSPHTRSSGAIDIRVQAYLHTSAMRAMGRAPVQLSNTSFKHAYWTIAQMVAHHTINGCNLQPGDLLGTGTQSGPAPEEAGSLLELSRGGKQPVVLPGGEQRTFLLDGDEVIMRAHCERSGFARLGFGAATGRVLPAREHKNE